MSVTVQRRNKIQSKTYIRLNAAWCQRWANMWSLMLGKPQLANVNCQRWPNVTGDVGPSLAECKLAIWEGTYLHVYD